MTTGYAIEIPRRRRMMAPLVTAAAACAAAAVVWFADPTSGRGFPLPPCPFKLITGLDCPGCGGTRMVYMLLHGDIPAALDYNALALAALPLFAWLWVAWAFGAWRGRRFRTWQEWRWSPTVAMVLIVGWTVVRNLPFPPFTSLAS